MGTSPEFIVFMICNNLNSLIRTWFLWTRGSKTDSLIPNSDFEILNLTLTLRFKRRSGLGCNTWACQIPAECYFQLGSKLNHLVNPKCIISVLLCCNKSSTFAVIVAKQYLPIFAILSSHHINVFLMLPHQYKPDLLVKRERV